MLARLSLRISEAGSRSRNVSRDGKAAERDNVEGGRGREHGEPDRHMPAHTGLQCDILTLRDNDIVT